MLRASVWEMKLSRRETLCGAVTRLASQIGRPPCTGVNRLVYRCNCVPYRYAMLACQLAWAGCAFTGQPTELLLHERDSLFQHFMLVAGKVEGLVARSCCFSNPVGCAQCRAAPLVIPVPSPPVPNCDVTTQEESIGGSLPAGPAEGALATNKLGSGLVAEPPAAPMAPPSQQSKRQDKKRRTPDVTTVPKGALVRTDAVVEPGTFVCTTSLFFSLTSTA